MVSLFSFTLPLATHRLPLLPQHHRIVFVGPPGGRALLTAIIELASARRELAGGLLALGAIRTLCLWRFSLTILEWFARLPIGILQQTMRLTI